MTNRRANESRSTPGAPEAYTLAPVPPTSFGRYTTIGKLGHGGMAEVTLTVSEGQAGFRKLVVIKRLHRHLSLEPGFIDMFLDEARLAARLNHPHCVQTYEVGDVDGQYFLAMEYLDGQGLERLLRISGQQSRPVPPELCARIISDALDGLDYAHELTDFDGTPLGVVHRDVSPQNLFITYDGVVKLLDFGIAKAATHVVETKTGVIKGKYAYIAPEQALGQPVDCRSDLWSMGVVLWETLTGRRLFKSINELATLHETLSGEVKLPSAFLSDLPTDLDTICMRALTRDPAERYQTAGEMKADLDRYLSSLPRPPGRRELSTLMRSRFDEVIVLHKATLATCLQAGGAGLSPSALHQLVEVEESSASGIRSSELPLVEPASTPMRSAPGPAEALLAPALESSPPSGGERDRSIVMVRVLAAVSVILLAVVVGLLLPLGESEPPPGDPSADSAAETAQEPRVVVGTDPGSGEEEPAQVRDLETVADDRETESAPVGETTAEREDAPVSPIVPRVSTRRAIRRRRGQRRAAGRESATTSQTEAAADVATPETSRAAAPGRLSLVTSPWTRVSWNGRDLGTTPLINVEMPPGQQTLRLVNRERGIDRTHRVQIRSGERTPVRLGL